MRGFTKEPLGKMENNFDNSLNLIGKISREEINGKTFGELFNCEEDYLGIIRVWGAALNYWKQNNLLENLKEKAIFYYRRTKSKERLKECLKYKIDRNQVAFFPISITQTMLIEPVIKNLLECGEHPYVLRFDNSLNAVGQELKKRSIPHVNLEYFLNDEAIKNTRKTRERFDWVLQAYKKILKRDKSYSILHPFFYYYFGNRNRFYEVVEFMEAFKIFLKRAEPSLVFLADDSNDIPRAASYLCKKMGVPCVVSQHGNINSESIVVGEVFAIKRLVFGNFVKNILKNKGVPIEKIKIVGSPLYDSLKETQGMKRDKLKFKKSIGVQNNEKIILFNSSMGKPEDLDKKIEFFARIIKKHPDLKLVIKQHPAEYSLSKYDNLYKKLAKKHNIPIVVSRDKISNILNASDVFVSIFSTTIIEALALGIPIIILDTRKENNYESFPESKRVLEHVTELHYLDKVLMKILESKDTKPIIKNRENVLKNNAFKIDGKSTERIIEIINTSKLK